MHRSFGYGCLFRDVGSIKHLSKMSAFLCPTLSYHDNDRHVFGDQGKEDGTGFQK
jgi:hypothetical protein